MRFDKSVEAEAFRRLTGVKRSTFDKMIGLLTEAQISKKRQGGHPNKLSLEEMLLMTLECL